MLSICMIYKRSYQLFFAAFFAFCWQPKVPGLVVVGLHPGFCSSPLALGQLLQLHPWFLSLGL